MLQAIGLFLCISVFLPDSRLHQLWVEGFWISWLVQDKNSDTEHLVARWLEATKPYAIDKAEQDSDKECIHKIFGSAFINGNPQALVIPNQGRKALIR